MKYKLTFTNIKNHSDLVGVIESEEAAFLIIEDTLRTNDLVLSKIEQIKVDDHE